MIKKLCEVDTNDDTNNILKGIEPLLRNKRREILLMGGNYEEVNKEYKQAIVSCMTSMPKTTKESAQSEEESPMYVEASTPIIVDKEVKETHKLESPP